MLKNDLIVYALQYNPKFKSLFDHLGCDSEAHAATIKALIGVFAQYEPECYATKVEVNRPYLIQSFFFYEEIKVINPDHRRPLFLKAKINGVLIIRALVDRVFLHQYCP